MDDEQEPVTRLGPDSGGRMPGEPSVRVYHWEWGPDDTRRPGLPWIGIFLLVFGGLLLIQQLVPQAAPASSLIVLAIGLAFLIKWAIDRGTGSLYAGAIITALAVPGLLNAAGIDNDRRRVVRGTAPADHPAGARGVPADRREPLLALAVASSPRRLRRPPPGTRPRARSCRPARPRSGPAPRRSR